PCGPSASVPHLLVVLSREVGNAAGGWEAAECGVAAVMVVDVQPGRKRGAAFGLGGVGAGVGPFVQQGAVVALDLAVGLRPERAGALVGGPGRGQGGAPQPRGVGRAVVGQYAPDGDSGVGEECLGALPERGGGVLAFVGQDLGVGQAGVVVDGGVQVPVA